MGSRKVVDRSLATVTLPGGLVPVVDALNDVVVVAELDGSILFANVATEALLGWSPAELVGRPLVDLVPERLRSAHLAGMSRFVEGGEPRLIGQPTRVPALRADGNEVAGIRLPDIAVPLATHTGWNLYRRPYPEGELCDRDGSYAPFALTRAQREQAGDPRLSVQERYEGPQDYLRRVADHVSALQADRLLLPEDAAAYLERAKVLARQAFEPR